jgi:hypothetical protein
MPRLWVCGISTTLANDPSSLSDPCALVCGAIVSAASDQERRFAVSHHALHHGRFTLRLGVVIDQPDSRSGSSIFRLTLRPQHLDDLPLKDHLCDHPKSQERSLVTRQEVTGRFAVIRAERLQLIVDRF